MGQPVVTGHGNPPTEADFDFYVKDASIERVSFDGSNRVNIVTRGSFTTGKQLAVDWSTGRLYFSDREGAAVKSVFLDGSDLRDEVVTATTDAGRRDIRNQCVGVTVDAVNGQLYWTQKGPAKGGVGQILRVSLERGDELPEARDIEVLWSGLPEPIDLEIDVEDGILYWTDRGLEPAGNTFNKAAVPKTGQPGGEITILSKGFHETIGLAVDKAAGVAYVGDLSGEIRAVNLDGTGDKTLLRRDRAGFTGLAGF